MFQISGESIGSEFQVVHTLKEAYDIVGARPEDFTERLVWPREFTLTQRAPQP